MLHSVNIELYKVYSSKTNKSIMFVLIIIVFNEVVLRQVVFLGNKVLIGMQVDTLVFQFHCNLSYHHSGDTSSGNMSGWRLVYVHC